MKRLLSLIPLLILSVPFVQAQAKQYGKIKVMEEKSITDLLTQDEEDLSGYRIHIFTGNANERQKAQNIKTFVENTYGIGAYVDWESPQFKVRVGDFTDKFEAIMLKHKLKEDYKSAYIVKVEKINL